MIDSDNISRQATESALDPSLDLMLARIRIRAKRRIAWLRKLWSEEGESGGRVAVTHAEIDTHLDNRDSPEAEAAWYSDDGQVSEWNRELSRIEAEMAADKDSRLAKLRHIFGLKDYEFDLLQTCLAVLLDPALARVYAYLHDHVGRGYPTEELAARLFGHGSNSLWTSESPLRTWELVSEKETAPGEPDQLACDPFIRDWVQGRDSLDESLVGIARSYQPMTPLQNWPVNEAVAFIERMISNTAKSVPPPCKADIIAPPCKADIIAPPCKADIMAPPCKADIMAPPCKGGRGDFQRCSKSVTLISLENEPSPAKVRTRIVGPPGSGRRTLGAVISSRLVMSLLAIDADQIDEHDWQRVFIRAQRYAYLNECTIAWHGERAVERTWPQVVPFYPVQFVICEPGQIPSPVPGVIDQAIQMPTPSLNERRALWRRFVPVSTAWPEEAFDNLVTQHRVSIRDIVSVAQRGVQTAFEAAGLIRETARGHLGDLAQLLECPFSWDDLVVTENLREALEDLAFEARERVAFWERDEARRLFPQGRGLLALFSGPPGTGKTMAAQVIAANLGLDLFRIDLSSVVSKYVGETSKNLERVLSRAALMDLVLLFDEADALFGKRTEIKDAHDRFANTDTGYLLQAIENYRGVAVLATNKKGNVDPAFIRRIRYVLEFPKPDAEQREQIWRRIVGELADQEVLKNLARDLKALATELELTGAQIKFAVLAATFIARRDQKPLAMSHLLRGIDRELMKEGRSLSERERERLLKHVRD